MYKDKTIVGVVTARGGSKGLPGKNIKPLCGKPLISWTIEQAKASRYLDRVVVTTDDQEIANVALADKVDQVIDRPKELALDTTSSFDVIKHALAYLEKQGESYDCVALLEPTSPLREPKDIDQAVEQLIDNTIGAVSIMGVCKVEAMHPEYLVRIDDHDLIINSQLKQEVNIRRQDLSNIYYF